MGLSFSIALGGRHGGQTVDCAAVRRLVPSGVEKVKRFRPGPSWNRGTGTPYAYRFSKEGTMAIIDNESIVRDGFWPKLGRAFAHVPFAGHLAAAYYCAFDPQTPLKAKGVLLAALAYFILPFDVIPDFILGLGFTDDMAVLYGAFNVIRRHLKPEHHERAREALAKLKSG
jgi:uncharacterized membrane protein YkvA (DUF1232 family)